MNLITTLEADLKARNRKNWHVFLIIQKALVEQHFKWLKMEVKSETKSLYGRGNLIVNGKNYDIELYYSPFFDIRFDRIYIRDKSIQYSSKIHLYSDMSLCLYHPVIDKPIMQIVPLFKMIPWITEWIVFYNQWKKYGVWLNKEIKH
ncbi:hypothetical protein [Flavobacterium sp. GSA192]|uniref:hypothetical protein n=1 Tax=Flavobacterium sp. GSA192 TaxID=2576304 RepID=UPI00112A856D|nr:hypothetical protein [Flavobacterium sp. GSA192]